MQTGYGQVTRVEVSVPYVDALVGDGDGKYYTEPRHIEDATERRRHRHRGPTLRTLVKYVLACDEAERAGKQLRERFERTHGGRAMPPSRPRPRPIQPSDAQPQHSATYSRRPGSSVKNRTDNNAPARLKQGFQ